MKCKFCFAEIEEDVRVCPACGKELIESKEVPVEEVIAETAEEIPAETVEEVAEEATEEAAEETVEEVTEEAAEEAMPEAPVAEKKKPRGWKVVLAVVSVVVLTVLLTGAILHSMDLSDVVVDKLANTVHSLKFWRENDVFYRLSYTADTDELNKLDSVEIATVGDQVLTNGELQAHYWLCIYDAISYGEFPKLDLKTPFDQQIYDEETGKTYQQMFLENAIESWRRYAVLNQLSQQNGFVLEAEQQKDLDSFPTELEEMAKEYGYEDMEKFIREQFFVGCTVDSYLTYNRTIYTAFSYYDILYEGMVPTQDQLETYYTEHLGEFTENGIDKDAGNYYDVRHILIAPEGGAAGGNYTDKDWEDWRASAQFLLDDFLADDPTEEKFAALAKEQSVDGGSKTNGGLYTNLTKKTNFVEEFKNWYLDESRQPGDTGLIKTEHGYHIMYFSGSTPIWEREAQAMVISENTEKLLEEAKQQWPMTVDFKKIKLAAIDLGV